MDPSTDRPAAETSFLATVRRHAWLIAVTALLVAGAAAAFAYTRDEEYEAEAQLLFRGFGPELQAIGIAPEFGGNAERIAANNAASVEARRVEVATAEALGGALDADAVDERVSIEGTDDTDVVAIVASDADAARAARVANAYARTYQRLTFRDESTRARRTLRSLNAQYDALGRAARAGDQGTDLRRRIQQLTALAQVGTGSPEVIQAAEVPDAPAGSPARTVLLGLLFGLALGVAVALLRDQVDRRLRNTEDVSAAFEAPVLTTVPRQPALAQAVSFATLPPEAAESFRMLQAGLRYMHGTSVRSVLITSARSGEGKTTVAWNLASAAARAGSRVVLVEADLRRPVIAARYRVEPEPGLVDVLRGEAELADALQRIPISLSADQNGRGQTFGVLVAGAAPSEPTALLQSSRMVELIEALELDHDLVVVDTAPVTHVADAIGLVRQVDGVVVAASVGSTSGPEARRLHAQLAELDARILGVVANGGTTSHGYAYAGPPARPA